MPSRPPAPPAVAIATAAPAPPRRGKKSWREKLADDKGLPKIVRLDGDAAARWGPTLLIPSPREVDALMGRVPRGCVVTINEHRTALAEKHRAAAVCPITTGIFSWIAAQAAAEAAAAGETGVTPYWRTLKAKGELNPKYPGGIPALTARLEAEGHRVVQKGKRFFVADYRQSLAQL